MLFLYIFIISLIAIMIFFFCTNLFIKKQALKDITNKLSNSNYKFTYERKKPYDFKISLDNKNVYLKYIIVPHNSSITINYKDTWKLSWGGATYNKGRSYPHSKYLDEIKEFANFEVKKVDFKIFIIYKDTEYVNRYLNECELDLIDITKTPYGYKLVYYNSMEEDLNKIFNC